MSKKVAILLCTYQGQQYLKEQLDSYASQTYLDWSVWVSDDGSKDNTHALLAAYQAEWPSGKLSVVKGPGKGFVANFLSLACNPDVQADYYSYSDQDDVWESEKLERAVAWLSTVPSDVPALYCSRTQLIDEHGLPTGLSPLFTRTPAFGNALVQNIAGGNTMVFNDAARSLLQQAGAHVQVAAHDWWTYLVISACGGLVHYDPRPSLKYRQHALNLIGSNNGIGARLTRIRMLFRGDLKRWTDQNILALMPLLDKMPAEARAKFELFRHARSRTLFPRVVGIIRSGIYRQTMLGSLGLLAAALFNKI